MGGLLVSVFENNWCTAGRKVEEVGEEVEVIFNDYNILRNPSLGNWSSEAFRNTDLSSLFSVLTR